MPSFLFFLEHSNMYLYATFPADKFYTKAELAAQWQTEAAKCRERSLEAMAVVADSIAASYLE